ncbi:unnamed protein product, partial [Amoebophrya sp. A25]
GSSVFLYDSGIERSYEQEENPRRTKHGKTSYNHARGQSVEERSPLRGTGVSSHGRQRT